MHSRLDAASLADDATQPDQSLRAAEGPSYMPQLDGVRAVAAVFVLAQHTWTYRFFQFGVNGVGIWGVWLFFVLSGFLITGVLLGARDDAPTLGAALRRFYVRRSLRIFPLYYAVLLVGVVFGIGTSFRHDFAWHALYANNWAVVFQTARIDPPAGPLWSLAIEEQFYLVWPLVVLLVPTRWLPRVFLATAAAGVLSRLVLAVLCYREQTHAEGFVVVMPTTSNLDPLALGALLAWARWAAVPAATVRRWTRRGLAAGLGLLALVLAHALLGLGHRLMLVTETLSAGLLSVWLIERAAVGFPSDSAMGRALTAGPIRYFGTITYGVYLLHSPIAWLLRYRLGWNIEQTPGLASALTYWLVLSGVTVVVASASWFLFERPISRLKDRFGGGDSRGRQAPRVVRPVPALASA